MQKAFRASGVALAGLATSILTAAMVTAVDQMLGFNLFTMSFWVVVPVGAAICGFVAASGYYIGAKFLHQPPTWILLVQMVGIAAITQALIYWLEYKVTSIEGTSISQFVSFRDYLDITPTKSHMRVGRAARIDTGEVGSFGCWLAVFQFVGFLVGGGSVYVLLKGQPVCKPCNKYLRTLTTKKDSFDDAESLSAYYDNEFVHPVDSPEFAAHVGVEHAAGKRQQGTLNLETKVLGCPACGTQAVSEKVQVFNGREWKDVDELKRLVQMPAGINVAHAYR